MAAPAYQTDEGTFRLDLSCLAEGTGHVEEALDAVKSIDILAGQWPSDALQQVTTLDQSQLLALQVTFKSAVRGVAGVNAMMVPVIQLLGL